MPGMTSMESLAFLSVTSQAGGADVLQPPPGYVCVVFGVSPGKAPVDGVGILQQPEEQGWGPLGAFSGEKAPEGRLGLLQQTSGQPRGPEVSFPEDRHRRVVKDGLIFDLSQSWGGVC